jgi:hypothetical protein
MTRTPKRRNETPRKVVGPSRPVGRLGTRKEESMEAKVDVRKLQILNDRINQTIDALSQVRLSVHGLGHTGVPTQMMNPFSSLTPGFGYPTVPNFPGIPSFPPVSPYGMIPPIPGPIGLSHTPYNPIVNPLFNLPTPFGTPFVNPMIPPIPTPGVTPNWVPTPWTGFGGGLFHTPIDPLELKLLEARSFDPIRIRETFPFVIY